MMYRHLLIFFLWAFPLLAQDRVIPDELPKVDLFREEIDVRLVEIEVIVTDPDGRSITGLSREDFELRQGRKRLSITHFTAHGSDARAVPETKPLRTAEDLAYLVIYIDYAYLEPGELSDVVRALRAFLNDGPRPKDRVLLALANHSLEIRHGFTSLHELIADELDQLEPQPPRGRAMAEFPRLLQEIERVAQQGADGPSLSGSERPMALRAEIESFIGQNRQELALATLQLRRLLPALAGLPGRKAILYVGGSPPTDVGRRLYNAWNTAFGVSSVYQRQRGSTGGNDFGRLLNTEPEAAAQASETGELFRELSGLANAHGVKLHMLDTGGLRRSRAFVTSRGTPMTEHGANVNLTRRAGAGRRVGDPQMLEMMARATGGHALIHSRDFENVLGGVAEDLRHYYVLGFEPPKGSDGLRGIRVRLRGKFREESKGRGRFTVRSAEAYRPVAPDRLAADRAIAALILGEASNPLGFTVRADPPEPVDGKKDLLRLPLHVFLPVSRLQWIAEDGQVEGGNHRGQLSIYLTAGDLERGAGQVQKVVVPLRLTEEEFRGAFDSQIDYKIDLPIALGSRRVAVTVRDDLRPLTSTVAFGLAAGSSFFKPES